MLERMRTLATAAVTYLVLANVVAQAFISEFGATWPEAATWAARISTFLVGVAAIVRRVTPVPPEDRGLKRKPGTAYLPTVTNPELYFDNVDDYIP